MKNYSLLVLTFLIAFCPLAHANELATPQSVSAKKLHIEFKKQDAWWMAGYAASFLTACGTGIAAIRKIKSGCKNVFNGIPTNSEQANNSMIRAIAVNAPSIAPNNATFSTEIKTTAHQIIILSSIILAGASLFVGTAQLLKRATKEAQENNENEKNIPTEYDAPSNKKIAKIALGFGSLIIPLCLFIYTVCGYAKCEYRRI